MIIHKEGHKIIFVSFLMLLFINFLVIHFLPSKSITNFIVSTISVLLFGFIITFFRNPKRKIIENEYFVFSPADGKIVVNEIVNENEFLNEQRIQISIFMSIFNVHKNWLPVSGVVIYKKYHKGKYFIASLPKCSELNERNTIVIKNQNNIQILIRQIAGFIARRIICDLSENQNVKQAQELGFIKFGSRVDVFLPLDSIVKVKIGDKVQGGLTVIADLPKK